MKRSYVHPLRKGSFWLVHSRAQSKKYGSLGRRDRELFVPDSYEENSLFPGAAAAHDLEALAESFPCGIDLHAYPLEVVDYFGHYFLPVEKAA